jgi:hypothetical protein
VEVGIGALTVEVRFLPSHSTSPRIIAAMTGKRASGTLMNIAVVTIAPAKMMKRPYAAQA